MIENPQLYSIKLVKYIPGNNIWIVIYCGRDWYRVGEGYLLQARDDVVTFAWGGKYLLQQRAIY